MKILSLEKELKYSSASEFKKYSQAEADTYVDLTDCSIKETDYSNEF